MRKVTISTSWVIRLLSMPTRRGSTTVKELFAPRFMKGERITEEEQYAMAAELGADSLFYLPLEAVARCICLPETSLCRACLTGQYPTPTGERLYRDESVSGVYRRERCLMAAAARCLADGGTSSPARTRSRAQSGRPR